MEFRHKAMNAVYAETLNELIENDANVYCLEADLARASMSLPVVKDRHPEHYVNVGVCEANMIGVAAGMAREGKIPFCATFSSFASRRACDQIAISVAFAGNNVKIVGMEPGLTSGPNGGTHMSFEDIAILRAIPGMHVYSPCDVFELRSMMRQMAGSQQYSYMQLLRPAVGVLFDESYEFVPGRLVRLTEGNDVTLISLGFLSHHAARAVEELAADGMSVDFFHCPCAKPLDADTLISSARRTGAVVTVESQNILGGLGSAVCEILSEEHPVRVRRLGVPDAFGEVATGDYLLDKHGFGVKHIVAACRRMRGATR